MWQLVAIYFNKNKAGLSHTFILELLRHACSHFSTQPSCTFHFYSHVALNREVGRNGKPSQPPGTYLASQKEHSSRGVIMTYSALLRLGQYLSQQQLPY